MSDDAKWYRCKVGLPIKRALNRLIAGLVGTAGVYAAWLSLPPAQDDGEVRWFGLVVAALMFWLARKGLTASVSVIDGLGEEPDGSAGRRP